MFKRMWKLQKFSIFLDTNSFLKTHAYIFKTFFSADLFVNLRLDTSGTWIFINLLVLNDLLTGAEIIFFISSTTLRNASRIV